MSATRWNIDPTTWIDEACDAVGRNLTLAEWEQYVSATRDYESTCPQYPPGT